MYVRGGYVLAGAEYARGTCVVLYVVSAVVPRFCLKLVHWLLHDKLRMVIRCVEEFEFEYFPLRREKLILLYTCDRLVIETILLCGSVLDGYKIFVNHSQHAMVQL